MKDYADYFDNVLNETEFVIRTEHGEFSIILLERHVPHLIGLHHFKDMNSKTILKRSRQLAGDVGFLNMKNGNITIEMLARSRGGTIYRRNMKKRVLSLNMIRKILIHGDYYNADGIVKGNVNAKYIVSYEEDNVRFSLCIEEDIKYDRLGHNYCCISDLINDNYIKKEINEGRINKLDIISITHKDLYGNDAYSYIDRTYDIVPGNASVAERHINENTAMLFIRERYRAYITLDYIKSVYVVYYLVIDGKTSRKIDNALQLNITSVIK